jgi:hypothetical protein
VSVRTLDERARQAEPVLRLADWARETKGRVESTISGSSMGSTLPDGTKIEIDLTDRAFVPGSVVALLSGHAVYAHRVVSRGRTKRASNYWITRGDALTVCDAPVDASLILGRVYIVGAEGSVTPPPEPPRSLTTRAIIALVAALLAVDVRLSRFATRVLASIARRGAQSSATP